MRKTFITELNGETGKILTREKKRERFLRKEEKLKRQL